MTYEEALDRAFASDWEHHFKYGDDNVKREEAKQMIIEACKRSEPKRPTRQKAGYYIKDLKNGESVEIFLYYCPYCGRALESLTPHHCKCGQAIDWSDSNDRT